MATSYSPILSSEWSLRVFSILLGSLIVYATYYFLSVVKKPQLIHKPGSSLARFLVQYCPVISEAYRPTIWCSGARAQTVVASLLKRTLPVRYRRELLETPDGGEIALDWVDNNSETLENPAAHPTVLILPGLTGTSRQNYILHLVQQITQNGYRVVVFNNRGLGGVPLKTPRAFCAANTEDLEFVVSCIHKANPDIPLLAVGVCLGGIILTNYLAHIGSQGKDTGLVGALTVSVPWNLGRTTESLGEPLNRLLFNHHLTKCLHKLIRKNRAIFESNSHNLTEGGTCTVNRTLQSTSLYEFDSVLTAPMFGFETVDAYYKAATLDTKPLEAINVPLVCLSSADDPFAPEDSIPYDLIRSCPNVVLALTTRGGHIGFSEGLVPTGPGYADKFTGQYVKAMFEHGTDIDAV